MRRQNYIGVAHIGLEALPVNALVWFQKFKKYRVKKCYLLVA